MQSELESPVSSASVTPLVSAGHRIFWSCCRIAVIVLAGWIVVMLLSMDRFGQVDTEFTDLSGLAAKNRLDAEWPPGVDPADVQQMSRKSGSNIDSHSNWYRIQLTSQAAEVWGDDVHAREERASSDMLPGHFEKLEGLRREVTGPPPLHRQTGSTPAWWTPPAIGFRATEVMLWYKGGGMGYGRATYSCFDNATSLLWVYEYGCQHDKLWSPGEVPVGDQFTTTKPAG